MPCVSPQTAAHACLDITQVNCPQCDQLMLHTTLITIPCHVGQEFHRSSCVNCLLMEMDDCCCPISEETLAKIDDYIECKLIHKTQHAQEVTDHAISNFLEYALRSVVYVDDASNNSALASSPLTQKTTLQHGGHVLIDRSNSADRGSEFEDSDVEIICNDLSEEELNSCTNLTNSSTPTIPTTPDDLPDYVDDYLPPPNNVSMIYNEILSEQEMSESMDDIQRDCPEWLCWKH